MSELQVASIGIKSITADITSLKTLKPWLAERYDRMMENSIIFWCQPGSPIGHAVVHQPKSLLIFDSSRRWRAGYCNLPAARGFWVSYSRSTTSPKPKPLIRFTSGYKLDRTIQVLSRMLKNSWVSEASLLFHWGLVESDSSLCSLTAWSNQPMPAKLSPRRINAVARVNPVIPLISKVNTLMAVRPAQTNA